MNGWEITEHPNGMPIRVFRASTPREVAMILRLPWSQGFYTIKRTAGAPAPEAAR